MKKLLLGLLLALAPSAAFAQCTGIFPPGTFCGNNTGSPAAPFAVPGSGSVTGPGSSNVNDLAIWTNTFGTTLGDLPPSPLSTANDTNVTVIASGSPSTALVHPVLLTFGWTGVLASGRLNANVVQAVTNDTNVTGSISAQNLTLGWTGTLAAGRLNTNVVQSVVNDSNVTGSISGQALTLGWTGSLPLSRGGCAGVDQPSCLNNIFPGPNRTGDIIFWNGSIWTTLSGNNSGTQFLSENSVGLPSWGTIAGSGTVTNIATQAGITGGPITSTGTIQSDPAYQGWATQNCTLAASVGSNLLTVALKDNLGNDPSAASPCNINFRSPTVTVGSTSSISQTTAISISTNATGATLGTSNNTAFRLWVVAFNNAASLVLGLFNASTATQIFPLNEGLNTSSIAISGSATNAGTIYTPNGTTVTNKPFRILGYVEYNSTGLVTAGTYATSPNFIQIFGPGIRKPGEEVQVVTTTGSTAGSQNNNTTTLGSYANNAQATITPTSAANPIRITMSGSAAISNTGTAQFGIGRGSTAIGSSVAFSSATGGNAFAPLALAAQDLPNTTAAQLYQSLGRVYGAYSGFFPAGTTGTINPAGGYFVELKEIQG